MKNLSCSAIALLTLSGASFGQCQVQSCDGGLREDLVSSFSQISVRLLNPPWSSVAVGKSAAWGVASVTCPFGGDAAAEGVKLGLSEVRVGREGAPGASHQYCAADPNPTRPSLYVESGVASGVLAGPNCVQSVNTSGGAAGGMLFVVYPVASVSAGQPLFSTELSVTGYNFIDNAGGYAPLPSDFAPAERVVAVQVEVRNSAGSVLYRLARSGGLRADVSAGSIAWRRAGMLADPAFAPTGVEGWAIVGASKTESFSVPVNLPSASSVVVRLSQVRLDPGALDFIFKPLDRETDYGSTGDPAPAIDWSDRMALGLAMGSASSDQNFNFYADWNLDSAIDSADATALLPLLDGASAAADVDGSGFVDSDDFSAFVADFVNGCRAPGIDGVGANSACLYGADADASGFVDSDDLSYFVTHLF